MSSPSDDEIPITADELSRAAHFQEYFIVWREDRFDRDDTAWASVFFLTRAAAEDYVSRWRADSAGPGNFERVSVTGPHDLGAEARRGGDPRQARAALRELERQSAIPSRT